MGGGAGLGEGYDDEVEESDIGRGKTMGEGKCWDNRAKWKICLRKVASLEIIIFLLSRS